jgi:hypothetical protein
MAAWSSVLNADPTDWLLEDNNPPVRYHALTGILGKKESAPDAKAAKSAIMKTCAVPAILGVQEADGFWGAPDSFYSSKYTGTVWQLIILAELGADGGDTRIKKACEFILQRSQDRESGGLSIHSWAKGQGGRHGEVIPCLTGNLVFSLIKLGYLEDPRVQQSIEWITKYQRFDDSVPHPPTGWPYDKWEMCWGSHTCHMGVVKALKALAEIPVAKRSKAVRKTIERAAEFLLVHHIHKRSHNLGRVSKPGWLKFGFPLMYQTDALEILRILAALGCRDPRMQEAINAVISRQDQNGKWHIENTYNDRMSVKFEKKNQPSKWITLHAVRVLKHFFSERD